MVKSPKDLYHWMGTGMKLPRLPQEKVREMVEAHSQSRQATASALQRAGASDWAEVSGLSVAWFSLGFIGIPSGNLT